MTFNDPVRANLILATDDPVRQKKLGRQVQNFDPHVWGKKSVEVVFKGSEQKVPNYILSTLRNAKLTCFFFANKPFQTCRYLDSYICDKWAEFHTFSEIVISCYQYDYVMSSVRLRKNNQMFLRPLF